MAHTGNRRRRAGMTLFGVLVLMTMMGLTFMTLASVAGTALRLTGGGRDRATALSLAEAGIDDTVDQLRLSSAYTGTGASPVTLYEDAASTIPSGTFATTVTPVSGEPNQVDVLSTGTTPNGRTRQVQARVDMGPADLSGGAFVSNGDIVINGSVLVQTSPIGQHNATARANGDITVTGSSARIDGTVAASGSVSMNPIVSSQGEGVTNAARMEFPSPSTISAWQSRLITQAQAGGTFTAALLKTSISLAPGRSLAVTGPRYITGNLALTSGETLTLLGPGPFYFSGDISFTGTAKLINATEMYVGGRFIQSGGTYAAAITTPAPMLVSFSNDLDDAIRMRGNSINDNFSVVYAVNGGIDMSGTTAVTGILKAGGKGATINVSGNYLHTYPATNEPNIALPSSPRVLNWMEL